MDIKFIHIKLQEPSGSPVTYAVAQCHPTRTDIFLIINIACLVPTQVHVQNCTCYIMP